MITRHGIEWGFEFIRRKLNERKVNSELRIADNCNSRSVPPSPGVLSVWIKTNSSTGMWTPILANTGIVNSSLRVKQEHRVCRYISWKLGLCPDIGVFVYPLCFPCQFPVLITRKLVLWWSGILINAVCSFRHLCKTSCIVTVTVRRKQLGNRKSQSSLSSFACLTRSQIAWPCRLS